MTYVEAALAKRAEIDAANALMTDEEALANKGVYSEWKTLVKYAVEAKIGYRFKHENKLYKTKQPTYVFEEQYVPGTTGTESLFGVIDEEHAGTIDDPIPYDGNMELFEGKYYIQYAVLYLCIRDSGVELYHDLKDLVGNYVEVVEDASL